MGGKSAGVDWGMPPFPESPDFHYAYEPARSRALRRSATPNRAGDPGEGRRPAAACDLEHRQPRRADADDSDYRLIAEIVSWFDLVAIQEVNDNLAGLQAIQRAAPGQLPAALLRRVRQPRAPSVPLRHAPGHAAGRGRAALDPAERLKQIKLPGADAASRALTAAPISPRFQAGEFRFLLVSVHLFFGSPTDADIERAYPETSRWPGGPQRRRDKTATSRTSSRSATSTCPKPTRRPDLPSAHLRGLQIPPHTSQIGSAIAADSHYDQIAFFPGPTEKRFTGRMNVFDFDGALFGDLWKGPAAEVDFLAYTRFHMSDHRPLWVEFSTG